MTYKQLRQAMRLLTKPLRGSQLPVDLRKQASAARRASNVGYRAQT